ncbi:BACON domain-containing protein, partial [Bacteroides heparinolyticus]|uniref:BACON domain-containing protein n=1 Tax=Prevotella heparinolytica TaxID=28113 RepID=UPI0035A04178
MKSHLYKVLLGLFAFALFLPSCKETNEVEEPTLDVSETALVVAKDAVEKVVTIQTNQTAWSYSSPQEGDWITLTQEGNSLRIKVAANDKGVERFGVVLVSAGVQKRITVTQSAGDAVLTLDTEKLELSAKGGTEKIGYTSNKGKATVEIPADATWIKVNSLTDNSLSLAIEANTTKDARSAKVVLTAGTTSKEIEVAQEGKLYFVLPIVS